MKVSELFEEAIVKKNPKLGYRADKKLPVGGAKEWQKTLGATSADVKAALAEVRKSNEYKAALAVGLEDQSADRQTALGSITFVGYLPASGGNPSKARRVKFTVASNGQVQETSPNDYHRAPVGTGKPRIVPNDPVASITKTMAAAIAKIASTMKNRLEKRAA